MPSGHFVCSFPIFPNYVKHKGWNNKSNFEFKKSDFKKNINLKTDCSTLFFFFFLQVGEAKANRLLKKSADLLSSSPTLSSSPRDFFLGSSTSTSQLQSQLAAVIELPDEEVCPGFRKNAFKSLIEFFYSFDFSHMKDPSDCLNIIGCAEYLCLTKNGKPESEMRKMLRHCE